MVGYTGYRVPPDGSGTVDVVQAQDLDARTLWSKYIALRKPVLIKGHLTDAGWKASAKWDDAYLSKMAGSSPLQVEKRDGPGSSYGQGRKQSMTLAQFLQRMAAGDDTLYLTTQQVGLGPDGHPELMGHPLLALQDDFELRPSIAGNLVPQQINLWMGRATDGASSGLHHDFHDNLYILMRGRKKFRLWDPSNAPRMYTEGKVRSVHANGRIVYEGQGDVLPDGSSAQDVALWHARQAAEKEVAAAELAVKRGEAGAARRLKEAEQKLEDVLEQELDQALEEGEDMDEDSEEEEEEEEEARGKGKGAKQNGGAGQQGPKGKGAGETRDEDNPPSFCRVQPAGMAAAALAKKFPDFPGAQAALECEVEAGSMLYLPAGWFHEVTSFSGNGSGDAAAAAAAAGASTRSRKAAGAAKAQDAGPDGGHMALNYWFHPPDNLDPSYQGFRKPYLSGYWSSLWRERTGEAAGEEEEEEGGEEGAAVLDDRHRPFEGVHVDEPEGGTGHTLKIEELVQQIDRDLKEGSKRRAGASGKRARGDDAEEEALAGNQGGAKKRSGVGRGADEEDEGEDVEGEEEEEDEDEEEEEEEEEKAGPIVLKGRERGPGGVSIVGMEGMNEAQRKEVHDQIKAMLMQGLLAQAQRGLEGPKQRLREFRPPLGGRRHHAVMFVPRPPRKE